MPAQLAVMIIKAAHPVGRQGCLGILGLSCLLDSRSGDPPDLDFEPTTGFGLTADDAVTVPRGAEDPGVGFGQGGLRSGHLQPAALQVEGIPPQTQPMGRGKRQPDGNDADRQPRP